MPVSESLCAGAFVLMNEHDSHVAPAGVPALAEEDEALMIYDYLSLPTSEAQHEI